MSPQIDRLTVDEAGEGEADNQAKRAEKYLVSDGEVTERRELLRVDINVEEKLNVVVEFEKLEINEKVPASQFVPNTEGYTEISQDELGTVIMMQVMSAMMQGGGME